MKRIVLLGNGLAANIFKAMLPDNPTDKHVLNVFLPHETLPNADFGLRYLHMPKFGTEYQRWLKNFDPDYTAQELFWGVISPASTITIADGTADSVLKMFPTVADYCFNNWRDPADPNVMNGLNDATKRHTSKYCASTDYFEFVTHLTNKAMRKSCVITVPKKVSSIDTEKKVVYFNDNTSVEYDTLVNTLPLPVFLQLCGVEHTLQYSKAIYVRTPIAFVTNLSWLYNASCSEGLNKVAIKNNTYNDFRQYNISRIVFKEHCSEFELSVNPKFTDNEINDADVKQLIAEQCELLIRIFRSTASEFNQTEASVNKYAHFDQVDVSRYDIINIHQLGRYAQWDHSVKIPEMFTQALKIYKGEFDV